MQIRRTLGTLCLSTLAVLATTVTLSQSACAEDTVRSRTTFKRTATPARSNPTTRSNYVKRGASPSKSSFRTAPVSQMNKADASESEDEGDGDLNEMTIQQLTAQIRSLRDRIRRLERLTGYSGNSSRDRRPNTLNGRVSRLENDLAPVIAQQRRIKRGQARTKRNRENVRNAVENVGESAQEAANNIGTGVSNTAKKGHKAAKKATDGISQGIKNGVNQAQETFGNMMPGGN